MRYDTERIKDIESILQQCGILDTRRGKRYRCINPSHLDKKPSAHIYRGKFYCGSCEIGSGRGDGLNAVDCVLMVQHNLSPNELRFDNKTAHTKKLWADTYRAITGQGATIAPIAPQKDWREYEYREPESEEVLNTRHKVLDFMLYNTIKNDDSIYSVLEHKWGLLRDTVRSFNLVCRTATGSEVLAVIKDKRDAFGITQKDLVDVGVFYEIRQGEYKLADTFIPTLRPLIIPIFLNNRIVQVQARATKKYMARYPSQPKYKNVRGRMYPFNTDVIKTLQDGDELYVVEGTTDCMALEQVGLNAVALCGKLNKIDFEVLDKIHHLTIVLLPDTDDAGKIGVEGFGETVLRYKKHTGKVVKWKVKEFPQEYKDIAEYLLSLNRTL